MRDWLTAILSLVLVLFVFMIVFIVAP